MTAEQLNVILRAFTRNHGSRFRAFVRDLGEADHREVALAFVANQDDLDEDEREAMWRMWCHYTRSSVVTSEIARVRKARRRDRQPGLF